MCAFRVVALFPHPWLGFDISHRHIRDERGRHKDFLRVLGKTVDAMRIASDARDVHDALMAEHELKDLRHEVNRHEGDLDAQLKRIESLEKDVADLVLLFKHLVESCASGRDLAFTGIRIPEQAQAKYDFNLLLDDVLKRRGLDLPPG